MPARPQNRPPGHDREACLPPGRLAVFGSGPPPCGRFPRQGLYAITDKATSAGRDTLLVAEGLLRGGASILQYRNKDVSDPMREGEAHKLRLLCWRCHACFIVNDQVDLALASRADGVHVGQGDMPVAEVRRRAGDRMIIGVSTHSPEQAVRAEAEGADYIGVGPVFATKTKKDVCPPVGLDYVEYAAREARIPWVAIGGIQAGNLPEVLSRGARLVAMVSALNGAPDVAAAARTAAEKIHAAASAYGPCRKG